MATSYSNVSFNEFGVGKAQYKDSFDVGAGYVTDKPFGFFKVIYTAIDCLKQADLIPDSQKETFSNVRFHSNLIKLARAPGDLLTYLNKWRNHTAKVLSGDHSAEGIFNWVRSSNDLIGPTTDIADFFTKAILYIPSKSIETLKGINGGSMVFGFGCKVYESLNALCYSKFPEATGEKRDEEFTKVVATLIALAEQVSYLALGVLTVLSTFFAVSIASVVFLAFSASSVALSIIGYYHKNIGTLK